MTVDVRTHKHYMTLNTPPEDWLRSLNHKFRERDIHVRRRPFLALEQYCKDFGLVAVAIDSTPAKAIFNWFTANTKEGTHQIGFLFTGVFYYDSCFWPVDVFIGYGQLQLNAVDSLQAMTGPMKSELMLRPETAWPYVLTWANSVDYGYGIDDLLKTLSADEILVRSLLENADRELRAAGAQLLEHRPNSKAAISCLMATEIFLKALLVVKAKLSEREIRTFNHHLDKILSRVRQIDATHEVLTIEQQLAAFPSMSDRYTGAELAPPAMWLTYEIALHAAAAVIRSLTDRNLRAMVLSQNAC